MEFGGTKPLFTVQFMKKHIVCIASEHKGNEFLEEAHNAGWHVTLVTRKKLLD